jgi:hypothetical protein
VLDHLPPAVEPEDVDACVHLVARPGLAAVEDDVVAVRERPHDLDVLARVLGGHPLEVLDERLLPVADVRIVLSILGPGVSLDGLRRTALVEHQVIERDDVALVLFERGHDPWNADGARTMPDREEVASRRSPSGRRGWR